jgi:hypothetical protein
MHQLYPRRPAKGTGGEGPGRFPISWGSFFEVGSHMKRAPGRGTRRPCASALAPGGEFRRCTDGHGLRAGIWPLAGIAYRQAALMSPQFRSVPPRLASTRAAGAGEASPPRGKLLEAHCSSCRPARHLYIDAASVDLPKRIPVPEWPTISSAASVAPRTATPIIRSGPGRMPEWKG